MPYYYIIDFIIYSYKIYHSDFLPFAEAGLENPEIKQLSGFNPIFIVNRVIGETASNVHNVFTKLTFTQKATIIPKIPR
jgi:hypothetical protein